MIRVLVWLIELGALFAVGSAAFLALCAVSRSFSGLLRAAATMVVGAGISVFVGLIAGLSTAADGGGDPIASALLATILTLPMALWVLGRRGRRRTLRARGRQGLARQPGRAMEPRADDRVASAWGRAARLAPTQRQRLAAAREACAYVLNWAETNPFDMDTVECAVLIRKRLPELVDQTASYCELAGRGERRTVIDGMVGDLESLGRMALKRVERSKAQLGDSLAATRAHIASRTSEGAAI